MTGPLNYLSAEDILTVPESPGLYAWFLFKRVPPIAKSDAIRLSQEIRDLNKATYPNHIDLKSTNAPFGTELAGTLEANSDFVLSENDEKLIRQSTVPERELVIDAINSLLGSLPPLLYIGKAENLRRRLNDHIDVVHRLREGGTLASDDFEAREFAERAIQRELGTPDLRFTYFEFDYAGSTQEFAFEAIKLTEFAINRTLRPILGRK